jgi:amino acid adenylation domain-containing protein
MLNDSGTEVLLSEVSELSKVSGKTEVVKISQLSEHIPTHLTHHTHPTHLCYIIYTSGTTGTPKGSMIEHRNVVRLLVNDRFSFDFNEQDVWTLFHSFCFDFSVWEMYGALLFGGKLVVIPRTLAQDTRQFLEILRKQKVTVLNQTPSAFYNLIAHELENPQDDLRLRYVIFGGEALIPPRLKEWFQKYPHTKLVNMYGITETTVHVTFKEITEEDIDGNISNIGKPIPTLSVYVMDRYFRLMPFNAVGECYVEGDGVCRGYLNQPELTAERFLDLTAKTREDTRISSFIIHNSSFRFSYRTGDLVRMLDNGDMEYVGRMDHQVKIRGFRVEPGETETVLLKHPSVCEAVVVAREDNQGDTYLCAYFVTREAIKKTPTGRELKKHLLDKLPDYMVPVYFVPMEKFPLTPSGKLDRKTLPDPLYLEAAGIKYLGAAPTDKIEEKLVEIWSEILNLDKSNIGIDDNFFERGGHSLKAARMASLLHKTFNINIPLPEIFSHTSIREMARYIRETEVKKAYAPIPPVEKKDYYSLSSAQKRLYYLMQIDETNIAYNIPFAVVLKGEPDIVELENTFRRLIERHESLRTSFHMLDNEPVQKIHDEVSFEIECHTDIIRDFLRPFDLSFPPLLRVGLIKTGDQEYTLLPDIHHIVSDGTSMGILVKEFMAIYGNEELAPLRIQYKDYSAWQTNRKQEEIIKRQEAFRLRQMEGELPVLNLPCDFPRPAAQSFAGRRINFEIGSSRTKALKELAKKEDITVFMMLLALFNILLAKLGNQEDIIVGTPAEGRRHEDLQDIVGMFVNTLALRNFPKGEKTALQFMKEVKKSTLDTLDNQEYQFEDLVEAVGFQRDNTGRNPIFDVMLVFQTKAHDVPDLQKPGLKAQTYEFDNPTAKFDMTLTAVEEGIFTLEYGAKLFKEETVQRFIRYFKNILSAVLENPAQQIAEIDYIPDEEKQQLLVEFNDTNGGYPVGKTIDQLVEEQVERSGDGTAVISVEQIVGAQGIVPLPGDHVSITYKELNEKSNQLAHLLRERGAEPGDIVALITEPSVELVLGILGILKAGGVFLPIDPDYPEERIQYILHDSNARILLTNNAVESKSEIRISKSETNPNDQNSNDRNKAIPGIVLNFEHLNFEFLIGCPSLGLSDFEFRASNFSPSNLAYIIYTSGSTGKPKGVAVQHQSLVNLCWWQRSAFSINAADRVGKFYRTGFDASIWEIFPYLIAGASVYIVEKEVKLDIHALKRCYETNGITIGSMPPQLYEQFITLTINNPALRSVQMGGDRLKAYASGHYSVVNIYGPTENTIVTTSFIVDKNYDNIPIGKPIANVQVYILNRYLRLQPIGVVGELCISGDGLAAGYLNQPELTSEKFQITNIGLQNSSEKTTPNEKFLRGPGAVFIKRAPGRRRQKIYKTGDLARWLADGNIEFWGRMDEQVKIRGFRIELGEIEKQLLAHDRIKEAVATAREENGGDKYLCAYIVTDSVETVTDVVLRDYLSKTLPQYMIPMYFVTLDRFPLTPNDKVDRHMVCSFRQRRWYS